MPITPQQTAQAAAVQDAAAHALESHVRLVAGPGTGKSQTIEERVRWLLANGVDADKIAVVSFTNASAIDLKSRFRAYGHRHGVAAMGDVAVSTLHSLALRILRQARLLETYPTRPLVLDNWELENIYDAEFGVAQGINSRPRRAEIRRYYEAFWSTGEENAATYVPPEPAITDAERGRFTQFHGPTSQAYSCVLPGEIVRNCAPAIASGQIDVADILGIEHLIVDEYQDLNPADLDFVDQVATAGVTIFVAGDDDQSIYSFRHASPLRHSALRGEVPGRSAACARRLLPLHAGSATGGEPSDSPNQPPIASRNKSCRCTGRRLRQTPASCIAGGS